MFYLYEKIPYYTMEMFYLRPTVYVEMSYLFGGNFLPIIYCEDLAECFCGAGASIQDGRPGPLASAVRSTLNFLTKPFRAAGQPDTPASWQQTRRNQKVT